MSQNNKTLRTLFHSIDKVPGSLILVGLAVGFTSSWMPTQELEVDSRPIEYHHDIIGSWSHRFKDATNDTERLQMAITFTSDLSAKSGTNYWLRIAPRVHHITSPLQLASNLSLDGYESMIIWKSDDAPLHLYGGSNVTIVNINIDNQ